MQPPPRAKRPSSAPIRGRSSADAGLPPSAPAGAVGAADLLAGPGPVRLIAGGQITPERYIALEQERAALAEDLRRGRCPTSSRPHGYLVGTFVQGAFERHRFSSERGARSAFRVYRSRITQDATCTVPVAAAAVPARGGGGDVPVPNGPGPGPREPTMRSSASSLEVKPQEHAPGPGPSVAQPAAPVPPQLLGSGAVLPRRESSPACRAFAAVAAAGPDLDVGAEPMGGSARAQTPPRVRQSASRGIASDRSPPS